MSNPHHQPRPRTALPSWLVSPPNPCPVQPNPQIPLTHSLLQGSPVCFHLLAVRVADGGGPHRFPAHARDLPHRAIACLCARAREAPGATLQEAQPGSGALRPSPTEQDVPCHMSTPANKRCKTARVFCFIESPPWCLGSSQCYVWNLGNRNLCTKSSPATYPQ